LLAATNHDPKMKAEFGRPFRARLVMASFPGLKPRLRKAYVAASYFDQTDRQTRARRSVAKEAWAVIFNHLMFRGPKGCWSLANFLTLADDLQSLRKWPNSRDKLPACPSRSQAKAPRRCRRPAR
jgi:hypothetical protein